MTLNGHFTLSSVFAPVCLELCGVAFGAWLFLHLWWRSANFKPKQTSAASCGFLAIARLSRSSSFGLLPNGRFMTISFTTCSCLQLPSSGLRKLCWCHLAFVDVSFLLLLYPTSSRSIMSFKPISQLRYDYDTTTKKNWQCSFFACVELEAGARDTSQSDRSRIVVESQL